MKDGIHVILHNSGTFLQFPADLVTFTEETLNGKLYFLCNKSGLGAIYQDCKNLLL